MKIRTVITLIASVSVIWLSACDKNTQSGTVGANQAQAVQLATTDQSIAYLRAFGGDKIEIAKGMIHAADGGFVMAGWTTSKGAGGSDGYLVKINEDGNVVWDAAYGQADNDALYSVVQASDGGFVAAGKIENGAYKDKNMYVVKAAGDGHVIWEKTFGGVKDEEANYIVRTSDNGYVVAGLTASRGAGNADAWIVKLSSTGDILWDKAYGTPGNDYANAVLQTADGGYVFVGCTSENADIFVARLDAKGEMVWNKMIGTANYESGNCIIETADGSLVIGGVTQEKPEVMKVDAYIVKLSAKGDRIWSNAVRKDNSSSIVDIKPTADGGFVTCGTIVPGTKEEGNGNAYLLKFTDKGELQWSKSIGGPDIEYGNIVIPQNNMYVFTGYIGYIDPNKAGNFDIFYGKF